ncbi:MAG: hypothetical protein ISS26_01485 [Candidatus Omnitrophica bacterium]|nr:hypothetical protein [Candidatus Omnitrophota bacterium]
MPASKKNNKLVNDLELLKIMLGDMQNAPGLFQPTSFWRYHERYHVPWLKSSDLNNFRSIAGGGNSSFGANFYGHYPFDPVTIEKMPHSVRAMGNIINRFSRHIKPLMFFNPEIVSLLYRRLRKTQKMLENLAYYSAGLIDGDGTLGRIEDSGLGNPTDLIIIDGKKYTNVFLKYFSQYVYAKKFIDFNGIKSIFGDRLRIRRTGRDVIKGTPAS